MLRIFRWVVRFFDWLRALDEQLEATWLNKGWPEFMKWWFGGSLAIGAFAFLLAGIPGTILLEVNRLYHFLKVGTYPVAGPMYAGLWSFAGGLAVVALAIAFVSCPLLMLQVRNRGK